MVSRSSRRAPISASAASGSSTSAADSTLTVNPRVPQSSVMSNHASQHSRVASTMRQPIRICRRRHAAHAVAANTSSSPTSNPTQAARQPPAR